MWTDGLIALAHVLVFVYWLGGDLGAFYTSRYLTRSGVRADQRLMAAKIVGDVDMAPRSALILTLPTGLALAQTKGWLMLGWPIVAAVALLALVWLAIAWRLHVSHGKPGFLKRLDVAVRLLLSAGLAAWAMAGLVRAVDLPLFLACKLLALAGCIVLGLLIRRVLTPLGPALTGLNGDDPGIAERQLAITLSRARPLVLGIWALLLLAALMGLATPTSL